MMPDVWNKIVCMKTAVGAGDIAQLVEHLPGIREVPSLTPSTSYRLPWQEV